MLFPGAVGCAAELFHLPLDVGPCRQKRADSGFSGGIAALDIELAAGCTVGLACLLLGMCQFGEHLGIEGPAFDLLEGAGDHRVESAHLEIAVVLQDEQGDLLDGEFEHLALLSGRRVGLSRAGGR